MWSSPLAVRPGTLLCLIQSNPISMWMRMRTKRCGCASPWCPSTPRSSLTFSASALAICGLTHKERFLGHPVPPRCCANGPADSERQQGRKVSCVPCPQRWSGGSSTAHLQIRNGSQPTRTTKPTTKPNQTQHSLSDYPPPPNLTDSLDSTCTVICCAQPVVKSLRRCAV